MRTIDQDSNASRRREQRKTFFIFLFFSAFEVGYLIFGDVSLTTWGGRVILFGAFFFPIFAVISWRSMRNNWSAQREDDAAMRIIGWMFGVPIILATLVLGGWALYSALGWLGTIPSWAAVIIILLIILVLK
jgi:hypothetical protein